MHLFKHIYIFIFIFFQVKNIWGAGSYIAPVESHPEYYFLSIDQLRILSQRDLEAKIELGWRFMTADRTQRKTEVAFQLFKEACEQNSVNAMGKMAKWYYGVGDYKNALHWHKKAIDNGNIESYVGIGYMYFNGLEVEKSLEKAKEYYNNAKEKGHPMGYNNMAYLYLHGIEVKKDILKGIKYYKIAAEGGVITAIRTLGSYYAQGEFVKQDYKKAVDYFKHGAFYYDPESITNLGILYLNGLGLEKDIKKGKELLLQACDLEFAIGMRIYATILHQGNLLKKDIAEALKYYLKAANLGDAESMLNLCGMYVNDKDGIEIDYQKALHWAHQAKFYKHPNAEIAIKYINSKMK